MDQTRIQEVEASLPPAGDAVWDHSSHAQFFEHYRKKGDQPQELEKFRKVRDNILRIVRHPDSTSKTFEVLDVGCAAGTQCMVWAEQGHRVHGLDVNEPLVELARKRAAAAGLPIEYLLGSALELPWPDASIEICLSLELLEHVPDWKKCLREFARVLRPGGVMFLATSNKLCPKQYEFNLPAFSWYPGPVKRYFTHVATTRRPDLANYATYPAINWFTPYSLGSALSDLGFETMDRFDLIDRTRQSRLANTLISAVRGLPALRWLGHVCTPGTVLLAVGNAEKRRSLV